MTKKKEECVITKKMWINALIAGGFVFFGAFIDGKISIVELVAAFGGAAIAILTQIRDSINTDKKGKVKLFTFY